VMAGFGDVAGAPCEDKRTAGYLNTNQEGRHYLHVVKAVWGRGGKEDRAVGNKAEASEEL